MAAVHEKLQESRIQGFGYSGLEGRSNDPYAVHFRDDRQVEVEESKSAEEQRVSGGRFSPRSVTFDEEV